MAQMKQLYRRQATAVTQGLFQYYRYFVLPVYMIRL